jgi:hypothetical protein
VPLPLLLQLGVWSRLNTSARVATGNNTIRGISRTDRCTATSIDRRQVAQVRHESIAIDGDSAVDAGLCR